MYEISFFFFTIIPTELLALSDTFYKCIATTFILYTPHWVVMELSATLISSGQRQPKEVNNFKLLKF